FSVDEVTQRVLITASSRGPGRESRIWVIALDLRSGVQTLLYEGSPAADGSQLTCGPNAAFDRRERRLLLVEPMDGFRCENGIFAVDADTGAFTRLSGGTSP